MSDPLTVLDGVETIATEQLAAVGWKLKRRRWTKGKFPAGWSYACPAFNAGGEWFRFPILYKWQPIGEPRTDTEAVTQCRKLERILNTAWAAREALTQGNAAACLCIGMTLQVHSQIFDLPAIEAAAERTAQSRRAKSKRRPRLRTRAMLAAFADGRETADAIEGFFQDGGEFSDEWGEISIDSDYGEFVVIDEGAKRSADGLRPTATITRESLPVLIAQIRKKPA